MGACTTKAHAVGKAQPVEKKGSVTQLAAEAIHAAFLTTLNSFRKEIRSFAGSTFVPDLGIEDIEDFVREKLKHSHEQNLALYEAHIRLWAQNGVWGVESFIR